MAAITSKFNFEWRLRSQISVEAKNMADLDAFGGRLAAEVNGLSWCKPPEILHSLKKLIYIHSSVISC